MKNLGNTLDEVLVNCPSNIFKVILSDYVEDFNNELAVEDKIGSNVISDFGGYFYLVENSDDLLQIETSAWSKHLGRYFNILESVSTFDTAEVLSDGYIQLFTATNNSGGNTYLIPAEIADKCDNIQKSIKITRDGIY